MTSPVVERLLRRHPAPEPSAELGVTVRAAAARSLNASREPSLPDRLWFSRAWRVGWVVSLFVLIALQLVMSGAAERQLRGSLAGPALGTFRGGDHDRSPRAVAVAREIGLEPTGSLGLIGGPGRRSPRVAGHVSHRLDVIEGTPPAPGSPPMEITP